MSNTNSMSWSAWYIPWLAGLIFPFLFTKLYIFWGLRCCPLPCQCCTHICWLPDWFIILIIMWPSLVIQWLRLRASTAWGMGSILGQRTKISHAAWPIYIYIYITRCTHEVVWTPWKSVPQSTNYLGSKHDLQFLSKQKSSIPSASLSNIK